MAARYTPRMRRTLAALALAAASTGCLPSRNNAQDPKNLPEPRLQIIAVAPGATGCPEVVPPSFSVGHAFPRSWCIFVDARDTIGASRFRFVLRDEEAAEVAVLSDGDLSVLRIPSEVLFGLEVEEPYTIDFFAENGGGGVASASQPLLVQNEEPVAIAGPSVTLPVNGFPWTLGVPFTVTFTDGGSFDPDGDTLTYCWSFQGPGEGSGSPEICSPDPADPQFTRTIPVEAGITRGYLRVSDGATESVPSRFEVFVGDPILWASRSGSGAPRLVDGERRVVREDIGGTRTIRWASRFSAAGQDSRVAVVERRVAADEDWVVLLDDRTPQVQGEILVGEAFSGAWIASDDANARVWTMRDDSVNDQYLVDAFDVTDDGNGNATLVAALGSPVAVPYALEGSDDVLAYPRVDTTGTLWFAPPFLDVIGRVALDGSFDVLTFPDRRVGSAAPRPGTTETWVADSPDFVNDQTGPSYLSRYDSPAAQAPSRQWEMPGQFVHSQQWIDDDLFWIADSELGVLLVSALMLDQGFTIDEATVARAADLVSTIYLAVDPATGEAFSFDVFGIGQHRIFPDGSVEDSDGFSVPLFADAYGALWQIGPGGDLLRSRYLDPTGIAGSLSVFSETQPTVDLLTGGIWTYSEFPSSIQHLAPDGRLLDIFETVDAGAGPVSFSGFRQIRAAFDGTWAVARMYDPDLTWIDFATDPPTQYLLPDPASGFTIAARPSSPANPTRFIWSLTSAGELYKVDIPHTGASLPAPIFTFTERARGSNVMAAIAPSMEDGSLCLLTVEDDADPTVGASTVRLRRILTDGTVQLLITTGQAPSTFLEIGTASTGFGAEAACWIVLADLRAGQEDTLLAGILSSTAFVNAPFLDTGRVALSFSATTNDTIWMPMNDPVTGDTSLLRADWDEASGTWLRTELDPLDVSLVLTAPNSSIVNGGSDEFSP